ncbi:MAG: transposase [Pseudonocardia sp.]|nr:transposase [Pseudonocardia sp.]
MEATGEHVDRTEENRRPGRRVRRAGPELTDEQWQAIEPLLPPSGTKGRPRVDDRQVINGMPYKPRPGSPGGIWPSGTGRGRPSTPGSGGGRAMAPARCWWSRRG